MFNAIKSFNMNNHQILKHIVGIAAKSIALPCSFLVLLFLCASTTPASAQAKIGYFSYNEAFKSMPEYAIAERNLSSLRAQYEAEMKRAENEFNKKYEEFLEGIDTFAKPIRQKRQSELQEMMERNVAFKQEAKKLLEAAERDAYFPLKAKMERALSKIGQEQGYACILNTDSNACPYIDPNIRVDITKALKELLNSDSL